MNWKLIVLGGLAFFVTTQILGFGTGILIHNGVLKETYKATSEHWRPELNQDPPDMAALMPEWLTIGCIVSLVVAALFGWVRPAFSGPGWKQGLSFGLFLTIVAALFYLGMSGAFQMPSEVWIWWVLDTLVLYSAGGTVLGLVAGKVAPP